MTGLGSGNNGELTFLDILALLSFYISLQNLNANLTQNDKQDLQQDLQHSTQALLQEIHAHLSLQDTKIDEILKRLEDQDVNYQET